MSNPEKPVRLSVNVSPATAQAFRSLIRRKGLSITEGVRRAIAVWRFVEDETAKGNRLVVEQPDGTRRELVCTEGPSAGTEVSR